MNWAAKEQLNPMPVWYLRI